VAEPPPPGPASLELALWDSVKDSKDPEDLQAYLQQYPNGKFAAVARNRLRRLEVPSNYVQRFYWFYLNQPNERRDWSRSADGVWTEVYPSGAEGKFVEVDHETINGDQGVRLRRLPDNGQEVVIPYRGSKRMWLYFRQPGAKEWGVLNEMLGVK
jgi:hypothetical protein